MKTSSAESATEAHNEHNEIRTQRKKAENNERDTARNLTTVEASMEARTPQIWKVMILGKLFIDETPVGQS